MPGNLKACNVKQKHNMSYSMFTSEKHSIGKTSLERSRLLRICAVKLHIHYMCTYPILVYLNKFNFKNI